MKAKKARPREAPPSSAPTAAPVPVPWYEHWKYPLACLALISVSLITYANSFTGDLIRDSLRLVQNPRIQEFDAQNLHDIFWHSYWWPTGEAGLYRPLTTLSVLFNYAILGNGTNPAGYHWTNWLLHAINILLVFALTLRLARRFRTAFFVAALWAVHPVLTESVTNVAGRADLLAGMAVLGGLLLYIRSTTATGWHRAGWLTGLALAAAAGAASKESAVVLPALIVLYELSWWKKTHARALLYGCLATLMPIGLVLWQRSTVLAATLPAEYPFVDNPIVGADFWRGRLTAVAVLAHDLWLMLWPVKLSSDYSYSQIPLSTGTVSDWIAWATIAAAIAATVFAYRRNRLAFFFAGFAFLNLLPASNLLFPSGTIMAERLLYLPSIGFVTILVILIEAASPRSAMTAMLVFASILAGYSVRTWMRNLDWRDELTMAIVSLQTSPNSFKVHRDMADVLWKSDPSHANIDQVIAEADKDIAILATVPDDRNFSGAWNVAAIAHFAKGNFDRCSGQDDSAPCEPKPSDARAEFERAAQIALRATQIEAAGRTAYDRGHGTHLSPPVATADSYRILASARLHLGQAEKSLASAEVAKTIDPSNSAAYAEVADADLAIHHGEDAAIALIEGMFLTSDPALRQYLLTVYQSGADADRVDKKGCALIPGPNGPALNPSCEIVHKDFCIVATRLRRQDVIQQFACH